LFTGIVEELGEVVATEPMDQACRLTIEGAVVAADADVGDSIAVNGVCLTVMALDAGTFSADVMNETLQRSSLGDLHAGSPVNLERAMTVGDRLGGHIVQGHVDGVGVVGARRSTPNWDLVTVGMPRELQRYVVEKGSITVDGVSLTVAELTEDGFVVSLIPTTLALTTLGTRDAGDRVNLEVDVIAKYVERLVGEAGFLQGRKSRGTSDGA